MKARSGSMPPPRNRCGYLISQSRARESSRPCSSAPVLLIGRRLRPDVVRAPDPFEIGEERMLLGQPLVERRPGLEQRLMRDLDQARRASCRSRASTSARIRRSDSCGSSVMPRGLAHPLAVVEPHAHEMRHEGIAQRRHARHRSASAAVRAIA